MVSLSAGPAGLSFQRGFLDPICHNWGLVSSHFLFADGAAGGRGETGSVTSRVAPLIADPNVAPGLKEKASPFGPTF